MRRLIPGSTNSAALGLVMALAVVFGLPSFHQPFAQVEAKGIAGSSHRDDTSETRKSEEREKKEETHSSQSSDSSRAERKDDPQPAVTPARHEEPTPPIQPSTPETAPVITGVTHRTNPAPPPPPPPSGGSDDGSGPNQRDDGSGNVGGLVGGHGERRDEGYHERKENPGTWGGGNVWVVPVPVPPDPVPGNEAPIDEQRNGTNIPSPDQGAQSTPDTNGEAQSPAENGIDSGVQLPAPANNDSASRHGRSWTIPPREPYPLDSNQKPLPIRRLGSINQALHDIEAAWNTHNPNLLMYHFDPRKTVDVYVSGRYSRKVTAEGFYWETADAMSTMQTQSFKFTYAKDHTRYVNAKAVHTYRMPDGKRDSVALLYRLKKVSGQWFITRIDVKGLY